jgi:hypothetical protein
MARIAAAVRNLVQPDGFESASKEYLHMKNEIDEATKRQKELKPTIIEYIEEHTEPDDAGHSVLMFDDDIEGFVGWQWQRKTNFGIDVDAAVEICNEAGITEECILMVPEVNEPAVMGFLASGVLTDQQVAAIFPKKITRALVAKRR